MFTEMCNCYFTFIEFCFTIAKKDVDDSSSDESISGLLPTDDSDQPFVNHPFQIKETNAAIKMNIRVSLVSTLYFK